MGAVILDLAETFGVTPSELTDTELQVFALAFRIKEQDEGSPAQDPEGDLAIANALDSLSELQQADLAYLGALKRPALTV